MRDRLKRHYAGIDLFFKPISSNPAVSAEISLFFRSIWVSLRESEVGLAVYQLGGFHKQNLVETALSSSVPPLIL